MERTATRWMSAADNAARSGTYRLLARIWLREADQELIRELCAPPLCHSYEAAGGVLPAGDAATTCEQLAIDYCRLFIGPAEHLPPFQSVWQSGQFQGAATESMKSFVDVVGYDTDLLPAGMMLDHLGVQLDVMGHILNQISFWRTAPEGFDEVLQLARTFFARHLTWPADLLETAAIRARSDFYRSVVTMTGEFLDSDVHAFVM